MFHVPLDIMMSCAVSLAAIVSPAGPARAPSAPAERIWIAGRYDRSRIVVYFATAHFHDSTPASARKIAPPKADGFFDPISLSRSDVERFRTDTAPEHFAVGDRYDLVLDNGHVATVTLSSLVGFTSDEQVGNDSYVGALGTVSRDDMRFFTKDYYVLRPHGVSPRDRLLRGGLAPEAARPAVDSAIAQLLRARFSADTGIAGSDGKALPFTFSGAIALTLADGNLRYYARAYFGSKVDGDCANVEAWAAPEQRRRLHILATAAHGCRYDMPKDLPELLNVADLGDGRIALIVNFLGTDGRSLLLYEYRDGATLAEMRVLQSISAGE
ncbi:MAG TPA: hypothetical protein VFJ20_15020 [Gemmatimonadaceae bacterium]|nr:hypothetical protein [Gemmatimonadaceae bacterium]